MNLWKAPAMLLRQPMDLWLAIRELPLVETLEALAQLPQALEANVRKTNDLIAATGAQLEALKANSELMIAQLESMIEAASVLGQATPAIVEMVGVAKQQMELTTEQLELTNAQLSRVIEMSEPLDKVGQRIQKFLDKRGS